MKKSFVLHIDSLCVLEELTDEQKGQLFYAIYKFHLGEEIELPHMIKVVLSQFKSQFVRDEKKYKETCERRRQAGSLGGIAKASKSKQKVASASKSKQNLANLADSDNDSDNKKKIIKEKVSNFKKPSPFEIEEYAKSIGYKLDGYKFVDYYESKGWLVGKTKMKDWRATVRNWQRKNSTSQTSSSSRSNADMGVY